MIFRKPAMNCILAAILMAVVPDKACAQEPIVTIKGFVLDSACAFIKNLQEPVSKQLRPCLRQGRLSVGDPGG
jgi:hypothetical protein